MRHPWSAGGGGRDPCFNEHGAALDLDLFHLAVDRDAQVHRPRRFRTVGRIGHQGCLQGRDRRFGCRKDRKAIGQMRHEPALGGGRFLKEASDGRVVVVGADPDGSIYSNPHDVHQYDVEGVGEDFYPQAFDRTIADDIVQVTDAQAFEMTRRLAAEEGLLVGGSSGMAVAAAVRYARMRDLDEKQLLVVVLPDSGRGYLEKIFDDGWMREHGYGAVVDATTRPSLVPRSR